MKDVHNFLIKWLMTVICLTHLILQKQVINATTMAESKEFMTGKVLRFAVIHYPPVMIITKNLDGTVSYEGATFDNLLYISKALNITYEFVFLELENVKKFGLGPAQVNIVASGEVDMTVFGSTPSHAKYQVIDLTTPSMIEPYSIVVPWPKEKSRLLATIRPFQPSVWICVILSLVILAPVLAFISGVHRRHIEKSNFKHPIFYFQEILFNSSFLLSHLINQGFRYDLRLRSRGSVLLVGIWCLMCVVLANGYAGTLFSFLSVVKLEPAINSLAEVANSNNVKLLAPRGNEFVDRLMEAKNGIEKLIGDSLRQNPENLFTTLEKRKRNWQLENTLLLFHRLIYSAYKENGNKCQLTLAKEPISVFLPVVFGLTKNGPYTKAIDEQVQAQFEAGLINQILKIYTPNIDRCRMENQGASVRQKALSLVDMSSAFVVLSLGVSLSILVFLIELVFKCIKNRYF